MHANITFPLHFKAEKEFFARVKEIEYVPTIMQRFTLFLLLNFFEHSNSCEGGGGATAPGDRIGGKLIF